MFLLVLALLRADEDGRSSPRILLGLAAGAGLLGLFVFIEHWVDEPMLPLR
jgi:hypothetical protein